MPTPKNVVVDGSNIATEGRSTPSLRQLDQAVRQYLEENPGANATVVVDASFGHRIDPSERQAFEEAVTHGELVSPPAGAIGRGDAFLLRIAERIGAQVLSNDSFREFHAEHPWLFDEGRLMGATPVPGVGWIFSPRRPVRGPLTPETNGSRRARSPKKSERSSKPAAPGKKKSDKTRAPGRRGNVQEAIAQATEEALGPGVSKAKKGSAKPKQSSAPDAVNDPLPFITFVSEHPIGSVVEGTIVSFTSHGAMAQVGDMLCYVPLAGLGVPVPRRARDVLEIGEKRTFELVALDPSRRGAQLALPEVAATEGTVTEPDEDAASEVRRRKRPRVPSARKGTPTGSDGPNDVPAAPETPPVEQIAEVIQLNVESPPQRRKRTSVPSPNEMADSVATTAGAQKHPAVTKVPRVARLQKVGEPANPTKTGKVTDAGNATKTGKVTEGAGKKPSKVAPATKTRAVKKSAHPVKSPAAKKAARPAKKAARPAKKASRPAKKAARTAKKASATTKKTPANTGPKSSTKATKTTKTASPTKATKASKARGVAKVVKEAGGKRPGKGKRT